MNPKLERQLRARRTTVRATTRSTGRSPRRCAFGSLVLEGTPVRLAGQDTRRGTFSQRHGVLVDQRTEAEYVPLAHLADDQAPFMLYDTVLSEYAALGFEYGYSVADATRSCAGRRSSATSPTARRSSSTSSSSPPNDKWGQRSGLALLLPHGFEGQGPEHSSARIERYLTLCAEGNLRVVYPTTAAQYFHVLRRQVARRRDACRWCASRRSATCACRRHARRVAALTDGQFELVLDDRAAGTLDARRRHACSLCTGKIAHELMDERDARGAPAAVVRVEQLYPWPEQRAARRPRPLPERHARCGGCRRSRRTWARGRSCSTGSAPRSRGRELHHIARDSSASPASGSITVHEREQRAILDAAFA